MGGLTKSFIPPWVKRVRETWDAVHLTYLFKDQLIGKSHMTQSSGGETDKKLACQSVVDKGC